MRRNIKRLTDNVFDLLVIGGGIYGACVAWDGALRGLSVALVEKDDFGGATSANSLKVIHGGFRYLQQADFRRMRESVREKRILMRVAPHLVHLLPVLIPTYGHGMLGKEVLSLALLINSLISFDRNKLDDPQKHSTAGHVISRSEVIKALPDIDRRGLTGGAVFYDAQVYNSERLTLAFVRSASEADAEVSNYVEVIDFLEKDGHITGVEALDVLTGDNFNIQARTVVNTSGPWINRILGFLGRDRAELRIHLAKAVNLVTRPLFRSYAVGIRGRDNDRNLFFVPWRDHTLIGTSYEIYDGEPDEFKITEEDIFGLVNEVNSAHPAAELSMDDVSFFHGGLLPRSGVSSQTGDLKLEKHYRIDDYLNEGIDGLFSVVGVKYTTARGVAEKVVDRVFESLGQKRPKSLSSSTPLHGGMIERFETFLKSEIKKPQAGLDEKDINRLVYNYGSEYPAVLKYIDSNGNEEKTTDDSFNLLKAEVRYCVRNEMAQKMTDVVFRRTGLGTAACPSQEHLNIVANVMADELGWDQQKQKTEINEVLNKYSPLKILDNVL